MHCHRFNCELTCRCCKTWKISDSLGAISLKYTLHQVDSRLQRGPYLRTFHVSKAIDKGAECETIDSNRTAENKYVPSSGHLL